MKENESLDDAANRTLRDLTGLDNLYMKQVGAFGAVNRDPGERVISVAYCALINVKDYDNELREKHQLKWIDVEKMLTQLQHVYEAILGEEIDKRNFRKKIKTIDFIEKTDKIDKITSKRGAALYCFNKEAYDDDPYFKL